MGILKSIFIPLPLPVELFYRFPLIQDKFYRQLNTVGTFLHIIIVFVLAINGFILRTAGKEEFFKGVGVFQNGCF